MIKPINQGEKLATEIREAKRNGSPDSFHIWWLGQSGFLIQWNKKCLLFDPYLSDSLTKKYATTNKPHERISELVIDPSLLDCIDIVTSSHNHTDHLDAETLIPILSKNK
ncbi:MAG TPA: MBL fold metallo-hydrolase, partial [Cyclobacteriaceae bacterium]|nr:MBL fold metallo-hydrolase [Cyclobacteriaceae bacterium]